MHQIKIFKGSEGEIEELETSMNTWLSESSARVVNIFGNIAPQSPRGERGNLGSGFAHSDLFLAVVYETD